MEPIDVYIYTLNLKVETPVVEKFPAQVREGSHGYDEVIRWIGPNDYSAWDSAFDTRMLGVVNEPLDNFIELIIKRDGSCNPIEAAMLIQNYCCKKAASFRENLDMFNRGIGAATDFIKENEMNLNRTEELEIKKDIKGIKKALENIASGIVPVKPTTQVVVKDGDPFFGKLHMSQAHMNAWSEEFDTECLSLMGLMEECAELQQAASKYYRKYRLTDYAHCTTEKAAIIEEMAHVLVDIRMICNDLDISPDAIQQEIYKKYPDGYDLTAMMADNKPCYYVERVGGSE